MSPGEFRAAAHEVVDLIADYLEHVESFPVFPPVEPGSLRPLFPAEPPREPEPLPEILRDVERLIEPNVTHWQHPGFMAYFATSASGAGMLGEFLTAGLGSNAMLWRTSPVATELEEVVVGWLRQGLGLPDSFDGLITDTASTSSLLALAAARQVAGVDAASAGLAGRPDVPRLRIYASSEAHSSIEKAAMTLGIGRDGVVHVAADERFAMLVEALEAAIAADRAAGHLPIAIVATVGTTSSTSYDSVEEIADIAAREGVWLHVDAAYAGAVALIPERRGPFAGWERADSVLVNPHKWLFTPLDASLFLTRRMADLRSAFSLVPEYLRTLDRVSPVRDYNEYTPQLGRRFRALKLWLQLRWFGLDGLARRIERHIEFAQALESWVRDDAEWELMAPVPFSTVCLRYRPRGTTLSEEQLDDLNARLLDALNAEGPIFLSHTRLRGRFTIRVAIGNLRTEERHVQQAWDLLRAAAATVGGDDAPAGGA
jgi:aromatic-L-amino-acid decarboxylase